MKKIINLSWFSTVVFLALYAQSADAWVQKISLERVFVGENIRIHEVAVRCRIQKKERVMRKQVSSNGPWCSTDIPSLCSNSKVSAARELCKLNASEFEAIASGKAEAPSSLAEKSDSKVEAASEPKADSRKDLLAEQMLIEEQRIEIAQKRIELTRREVGLKKKLSEMALASTPGA